MKKISLLISLAILLTVISCGDDDSASGNLLSFDGDNVSGPVLEIGEHEAAARFPASIMSNHAGKTLTEIRWFMGPQLPAGCTIKIYDEGSNATPGTILYTANVSNALQGNAWNDHTLSTPVSISGNDIWISIALTHNQAQQSIGCDAGPAAANGDWLFSDSDGNWEKYSNRTVESVNWNIRGILSE